MAKHQISKEEYYQLFPADKRVKALETALDTRRFEIEMYWKRATYFWAFIATAFAGYFAVLASDNIDSYRIITILISFIGFVFSIGWYFVNRGSKFWQENWENHVAHLEESIQGPLFACVKIPKDKCSTVTGHYSYSVSKINTLLSLITTACWGIMFVGSVLYTFNKVDSSILIKWSDNFSVCCMVFGSLIVLLLIFYKLSRHSHSFAHEEQCKKTPNTFFRNHITIDTMSTTIKMGNDEFILYIRKWHSGCKISTKDLGKIIWLWIKEHDSAAEKVEEDKPCHWQTTPGSQNIEQTALPKTATQFKFNRNILPSLYTYLDQIGESEE